MSERPNDRQRGDDLGISRRSFLGLRWARPRTDQDEHGETESTTPPLAQSDSDLPREVHLGTIDRLWLRAIGTIQAAFPGRLSVCSVRVPEGLLVIWVGGVHRTTVSSHGVREAVPRIRWRRPLDVLPIELGERGSVIAHSGNPFKRETRDETSGVCC